jgi:alcohol dehydrogenase (cytochrome c)
MRKTSSAVLILTLLAIALLSGAAISVPEINWRVRVVALKLGGQLIEVDWSELLAMLMPGSRIYLESLAETQNPYASIENPYDSSADVRAGADLFGVRCGGCHSTTGSDDTKVNFTLGVYRHGDSDWALYHAIGRGIPGTRMEGHRDLSDEQRWQLVAFIRSLVAPDARDAAGQETPSSIAPSRVTPERLIGARSEPHNWLTYSGAYDGHRHSRLDQIDRANVSRLRTRWVYQMRTIEAVVEASPLVVDGVMYVVEPPNTVVALDASNGAQLWRYERQLPTQMRLCCGRVNRGVALLGQRVYMATLDAHLVALDAQTGHVDWDARLADNEDGYSATVAPLAIGDKIVVGISGGELGIRGFLDAYDAQTGKRAWRFYTIPGRGEFGNDSWAGNSWKTGGGATWVTGSYDPELGLVYWGVANPWPDFQGKDREGDNRDTSSVIALEAETGTLKWRFQFIPHDLWDYGASAVPVLVDGLYRGAPRKLLAMALKNGFAYLLDRRTGEFLRATQIAKQTWTKGIDENGRPIPNEDATPSVRGALVYPGPAGGASWWPPSFNPATGLMYIPVLERGKIFFAGSSVVPAEGSGRLILGSTTVATNIPGYSALRALDVSTGDVRWELTSPASEFHDVGGTLTTAGGLVFWSDGNSVIGIAAETGQEVWRFNAGGRIRAAPITYEVDGEQLISIAAGRSVFTFGLDGGKAAARSSSASR